VIITWKAAAFPLTRPVARAVRRFSLRQGKASWTDPQHWLDNLF
jgi:hypothetical protein